MTTHSDSDQDHDTPTSAAWDRMRQAEFLEALEKTLDATRHVTQAAPLAPNSTELHGAVSRDEEMALRRRVDHAAEGETFAELSPAGRQFAPPRFRLADHPGHPDAASSQRIAAMADAADRRWGERSGARSSRHGFAMSGNDWGEPFRQPRSEAGGEEAPPDGEAARRETQEILRLLRRRSQTQTMPPPPQSESRSIFGTGLRLGLAAMLGGAAALVFFQFMTGEPQGLRLPVQVAAALSQGTGGDGPDRSSSQPLRRIVPTELSNVPNQPIALGVSIVDAPPGAFLMIRGLPEGARISTGDAVEPDGWRVPVRELSRAMVVPKEDFAGTVSLAVDLILADGTVIDRNVLRLTWEPAPPLAIAPRPVKTMTVAASHSSGAGAPAAGVAQTLPIDQDSVAPSTTDGIRHAGSRHVDAEELAKLIERGEAYLKAGDIAAARLLLRRAAEGGDLRAMLAVAATYDPFMLKRLGVLGGQGDVAQARKWYARASELGSAEAVTRLQRLSLDSN